MNEDPKNSKPKIEPFVCFCNGIRENSIVEAIKCGAQTVDEVYDRTGAGVGGCGGSCRPRIQKMLKAKDSKLSD